MQSSAGKIPRVNFDVKDLIAIRGQLSGMTLAAIRRRASYRSGARDTRIRGRGMEYEESRAYVSGDDMRTMDWRVMARTGEAYTKVFAEEKQRRFLLGVDLSASMFFGTRYGFKSWAAAHSAAHMGWLASLAGDRIGGLVVSPQVHAEVRPTKTRSGLLSVFHHLAEQGNIGLPITASSQRLNFLLHELQRVVMPGSIIALISDFIGIDDESIEVLSSLVKHNDLNALWIHDQSELDAWPPGHYQILMEQKSIGFNISEQWNDSWIKHRQQDHSERIKSITSQLNIPLFSVSCNREISPQILQNLRF